MKKSICSTIFLAIEISSLKNSLRKSQDKYLFKVYLFAAIYSCK